MLGHNYMRGRTSMECGSEKTSRMIGQEVHTYAVSQFARTLVTGYPVAVRELDRQSPHHRAAA